MTAPAGYNAKPFLNGPSTPMAGGATAQIGATKSYQLTNTADRILDPTVPVVVKDNGVDHTANVVNIDYLFGIVTFAAGYVVTGPVTIDGAFLTLMPVPGAFDAKLSRKNEMLEATQYAQGDAQKRRQCGHMDCSIALKSYATGLEDFNSGIAGVQTIHALAAAGTPLLIQFDPDGLNQYVHRGWYVLDTDDNQVQQNALAEYDFTGQCAAQGPNSISRAGFGWGVP
jgi:hypothetical protein